ncbi:transposase, IS4 family [Paraburkholderia xenovorans LB400]|uniref:Transposase, IS4 family n=1 Tax=Paraburkholderia xenovorans (strain LB400) TaxID=266265 RepID=Q13H69_PARXL|nr:transposase, IS4 family [Paraburkholderia xenovorans LB400]
MSGRESVYTPAYVSLLFMLYRMHRLGLREFAGFMHDYWRGRGVALPVASFGHLSDLFAALDMTIRKQCARAAERLKEGEPVTVIVDSTGLRFSHAGAWYEKKYGKQAPCTPWRVMHLAMDAEGDVLAGEITDTETGDSSGLDVLLPQVGEIDRLIVDTAYYQIERNEQLPASGVVPVIPPKSDAVDDPDQNRWHDQLVCYRNEKGQYAFQNKYGYGLRARVEAQFSRIKRCLGDALLTRRIASQVQEGLVIANLINQWNSFGQARCVKFWRIFHLKILPHLVIATKPFRVQPCTEPLHASRMWHSKRSCSFLSLNDCRKARFNSPRTFI